MRTNWLAANHLIMSFVHITNTALEMIFEELHVSMYSSHKKMFSCVRWIYLYFLSSISQTGPEPFCIYCLNSQKCNLANKIS